MGLWIPTYYDRNENPKGTYGLQDASFDEMIVKICRAVGDFHPLNCPSDPPLANYQFWSGECLVHLYNHFARCGIVV